MTLPNNNENSTQATQEDKPGHSILQDASTLFMFSKNTNPESDTSETKLHSTSQQQPAQLVQSVHGVGANAHDPYHIPIHHHATLKSIIREPSDNNDNELSETNATLDHKTPTSQNSANISETSEKTRIAKPSHNGTSRIKDNKPAISDSYIVDPDAGTITCVCGYDEDDGFTIQCDHCFRWQHAICYNIGNMDAVPDDYLCNVCKPRNIDIKLAKQIQKRRFSSFVSLDELKEGEIKNGNKKKRRTDSTDSSDASRRNVSVSQKENGKEPKSESPTPPDLIRRKEHLITAKDAYPAVYIALESSSFKDPLVGKFLNKHSKDDCILSYDVSKFGDNITEVRPYSSIVYSRVFPGFNKLGIFASRSCIKGYYICEAIGELSFKNQYLEDPKNQYRIWGMPKRKVIFHDEWPLVIDQRLCGNESRYLRRSCHPNVELVTIKSPGGSIKFWYRALKDIAEDEELHVKWQWNKNHPILKLINDETKFSDLDNDEKDLLLESVDALLSACECACGNNSKDCYILKVKKIMNSYCKTIRSKMNTRYKINEIVTKFTLHQKKRDPPILERLLTQSKIQQDVYNKDITNYLSGSYTDKPLVRKSNEYFNVETLQTPKRLHSAGKFNHKKKKKTDDILKLLDYKEDEINELEKLAIPIKLPVDISDLNASFKSAKTPSLSNLNTVSSNTNIKDTLNDHETLNSGYPVDSISRSSTPLGVSDSIEHSIDNAQENHQHSPSVRSKKKLSFADYKKKLSK